MFPAPLRTSLNLIQGKTTPWCITACSNVLALRKSLISTYLYGPANPELSQSFVWPSPDSRNPSRMVNGHDSRSHSYTLCAPPTFKRPDFPGRLRPQCHINSSILSATFP
ncbi:hypothetical protein NPIL_173761 [Nephila pilipes]|uniref:Uncharacterized protein n=1 Tax=Nephila pilipes TaxID=299642 RepID=A0A8X6MUC7_NEPPI|nr:hypothetical protein NPIL_173761 [Nephila pilipes]